MTRKNAIVQDVQFCLSLLLYFSTQIFGNSRVKVQTDNKIHIANMILKAILNTEYSNIQYLVCRKIMKIDLIPSQTESILWKQFYYTELSNVVSCFTCTIICTHYQATNYST